jgi:hypothetical protein
MDSKEKPSGQSVGPPRDAITPANELFVLELDDRLEFGLMVIHPLNEPANYVACNGNSCNAYSC